MNYLRGALSAASQYYRDINPSTLTGAIDVIVVRRTNENGEELLACSPFHVRFGKWQVLRPVDKKVQIHVNGQEIPYSMKIGDAGEAFFVFETDEDIPEDLITSPLLEATRPSQNNGDISTDRFGSKKDSDEKGSEPSDQQLGEPEPLELDSPPPDVINTPRPSGLSMTRPMSNESSPQADSDAKEESAESGVLSRIPHLGKAVVRAVVETERDNQQRVQDEMAAAKNMAAHAYGGLRSYSAERWKDQQQSQEDKGDEALPDVKEGEGEPPTVLYGHDMVFDVAGYHSKQDSSESVMEDTKRRLSRDRLHLSEIDTSDSFGPSTSRSGNRSGRVSPVRSPDASRTPSPEGHFGSVSPTHPEARAIPTYRASSEPPDASPDNSPPAYSWEWGGFPTPSHQKTAFAFGHPSEVHRSLSVPPEFEGDNDVSDLDLARPSTPIRAHTADAAYPDPYPSPPSTPTSPTRGSTFDNDDDGAQLTADENNGRRFLMTLGGKMYDFTLSICEGLTGDEEEDAKRFKDGQVSFRRFMKFPGVVRDKNLVIKWNDRYITREDGTALIDRLTAWRDAALAKPTNTSTFEEEEPLSSSDEREPDPAESATPKKSSSSWVRWWRSSRPDQTGVSSNSGSGRNRAGSKADARRPGLVPSNSEPAPDVEARATTPVPIDPLKLLTAVPDSASSLDDETPRKRRKRFAKTLRLTSEQLKHLELKAGPNSITFSLSASGIVACTAHIFLWESTDAVVVSDIDGTITKSDALGHVFTMIGRDWTHLGVAKLYTDIFRNGYKIMYLTSRAIGQADSTRDYLKGINQNNYQLPEGPVIMSPDRLMASLHREVILRKPEVFKMACLRDIQTLFGVSKNPFYAGFGNRITDALSYRSVSIPSHKIFTIDSSGEVKMELLEVAGYKSSYIHLTDLVDQMFPPINQKTAAEFTDFNYWKTPVAEFPLPDLSPPSPALSARSDTSNQSAFLRIRNFSLGRQSGKQYALPPPAVQQDADSKAHPLRQMTSLERLSNRFMRSSDELEQSSTSTLVDQEDDRERRARNRLSLGSVPGSLPGSLGAHDFNEEDEEDEEMDLERNKLDEELEDEEDPEEAAEEGFDEDFLATGEMESVPFL